MFSSYLLAFLTGFLSLGLEILWVRLFSFANHSLPQAFAFVLMCYLVGIALGAQIGRKCCNSAKNLWVVSGVILLTSSVFDLVSPFIYAKSVNLYQNQILVGAYMITLAALLKSILFPIVHQLGAAKAKLNFGHAISKVYVSNILGATLGPVFIGLFLLNLFTTQQCFIICAGLSFLVGIYCLITYVQPILILTAILFVLVFQNVVLTIHPHWLITEIAMINDKKHNIRQVVENGNGIITTYQSADGDIIYGSNVYDGRTNLNPIINSNGIDRVIMLSAIQDKPKNVLMIGLSVGSWLALINTFPGVEKIDVVEINPGYLDVIKNYPQQLQALTDPRVHIFFDDGRRWLGFHPQNKYDLIIMNTTFHWRAYASNLLSKEFLTMMKQHMNPNAVIAFNTTQSLDAFKTANSVFTHAYLNQTFVVAADFDWRKKLHTEAAIKKLASLRLDGKLLYPAGSEKIIHSYLNKPMKTFDVAADFNTIFSLLFNANSKIEIVTDKNLITEYKHGEMLF